MIRLLSLFILLPLACFSQDATQSFKAKYFQGSSLSKTELKDKMVTNNFAKIWTTTDNALVYGFIGENYQRIRIKLISVTKDPINAERYNVYGKSMVKTNICYF